MKKVSRLDREINAALALHATKRSRLPADLARWLAWVADIAESEAAENLSLGKRDLGYTGDAKAFRSSQLFASRLPLAKYERLIEIIEEAMQHPHPILGRTLSDREVEQLRKAASKMEEDERVSRP